jgi:hypothetical protein
MLGKARLKGGTPLQTRTRLLEFSVFGLKYGKSEPKTSDNPLTEISGVWAYIPGFALANCGYDLRLIQDYRITSATATPSTPSTTLASLPAVSRVSGGKLASVAILHTFVVTGPSMNETEDEALSEDVERAKDWIERRMSQYQPFANTERSCYWRGRLDGLNEMYRRTYGKNGPLIEDLRGLIAWAAQFREQQLAYAVQAHKAKDREFIDRLLGEADGAGDFLRKFTGQPVEQDPDRQLDLFGEHPVGKP